MVLLLCADRDGAGLVAIMTFAVFEDFVRSVMGVGKLQEYPKVL